MKILFGITFGILFSCACADNNSEFESSLRKMLETPDVQPFVQHLQRRTAKKPQAELVEDDGVMFNTCQACIDNLNELIRTYRLLRIGQEGLKSILKTFCRDLRILSSKACDGIIDNYTPSLEYVYFEKRASADVFCVLMLGENTCEGVASLEDWTINIDPNVPEVQEKAMPEAGNPVQKVLHISDIHYDPTYKVGSNIDCRDAMCCTESSGMPNEDQRAARYWGEYECDMPEHTVRYALQHIADENPDLDMMLITGDFPAHDVWYQSEELNLNAASTVINLIKEIFPDVTVLPCMGNHEAFPANLFPVGDEVPQEYDIPWLYNGLADLYTDWIPEEDLESFRVGGYYSTQVQPGLRVISINSVFSYADDFWLGLHYNDPMGQLQWLQDELFIAEKAGDKVWILSHHPTGMSSTYSNWAREYIKIIDRYENIIVNQFFGHTHRDEFDVFYDTATKTKPISVGFIVPSLTPYESLNPAYRIYTVDGDYEGSTRRVIDYDTFYGDLSKAGNVNQPIPFSKLYNAKQDLGLNKLLPGDFDDLVKRIRDDDELWSRFHGYYVSNSAVAREPDQSDRETIVCSLVTTDRADDSKCQLILNEDTMDNGSSYPILQDLADPTTILKRVSD